MRFFLAIVALALCTSRAFAVREFVILNEPLLAKRVEGVVLDPSGTPIPGLTVSDCPPDDWRKALRTTTTDEDGRFRFSRRLGKSVYFLRFDHRSFNPLGLRLKVYSKAKDRGIVAQPPIGG